MMQYIELVTKAEEALEMAALQTDEAKKTNYLRTAQVYATLANARELRNKKIG